MKKLLLFFLSTFLILQGDLLAQNTCSAPLTLTPGTQQCGNSSGNTGSMGTNPCRSSYNDGEYWFEYTLDGSTELTLDLTNLNSDGPIGDTYTGLFVFSGSCGSLVCQDYSTTTTDADRNLSFTGANTLPAGTYFIVVASYGWWSSDGASFCLDATTNAGTPVPTTCPNMTPICTSNGLSFTAQEGTADAEDMEPGNNYGCLGDAQSGSSPNPTWYYLEISAAGDLDMELSANEDIDFALWGPFADLATAQGSCGSLPAPIDCSYLTDATEYPNIVNAQVGEVYVLLVTNFADNTQAVSLQKTGGTGETNCGIVCGSDVGTVTPSMANGSSANYVLCDGEAMTFTSSADYTLPTAADVAGLGYAIYTATPTTGDPSTDANWTGYYMTDETFTETNDASNLYDWIIANPTAGAGANGVPSGNQLVLVPITMDDISRIAQGGSDNNLGHDIDNDDCFDLGTPYTVTYLDPIAAGSSETCGINLTVSLTGGWPGYDAGSSYTVTNTGSGTMAQTGTQGETLTFTDFSAGDTISISVTDGNGCTFTFSVVSTCSSSSCAADAGSW